jgi:hypothetical protein
MPKKGAPIRKKQSRSGKVSKVARGRPLADKGYRLVFSKSGTNKYQAQTGMVKLLNNGSVVSEAQAFSGGNGHPAIEDGVYRVHLDIRGDESTNQTQGKAPQRSRWHRQFLQLPGGVGTHASAPYSQIWPGQRRLSAREIASEELDSWMCLRQN